MTTIQHRVQTAPFVPTIVVALAAAVMFPVLIHLLPPVGGVPNGVRLLPIFVAPLLLTLWNRPLVGAIIAVLAPLTNHLLTGMPPAPILLSMSVELLLFTGIVYGLFRLIPRVPLHGALAYIFLRVGFLLVLGGIAGLWSALVLALPGLLLLTACNAWVVFSEQT